MGLNVRVPGGWVGTRSVGLRVGPLSAGHAYRRGNGGLITAMITAPFLAIAVVIYVLTAVIWLLGALLTAIAWLVKWVFLSVGWLVKWVFLSVAWPTKWTTLGLAWLTKWVLSPIWLPVRMLGRRHRTTRVTRAFAKPPTGFAYDPTSNGRRVSTKSGARLQREAKRRAA